MRIGGNSPTFAALTTQERQRREDRDAQERASKRRFGLGLASTVAGTGLGAFNAFQRAKEAEKANALQQAYLSLAQERQPAELGYLGARTAGIEADTRTTEGLRQPTIEDLLSRTEATRAGTQIAKSRLELEQERQPAELAIQRDYLGLAKERQPAELRYLGARTGSVEADTRTTEGLRQPTIEDLMSRTEATRAGTEIAKARDSRSAELHPHEKTLAAAEAGYAQQALGPRIEIARQQAMYGPEAKHLLAQQEAANRQRELEARLAYQQLMGDQGQQQIGLQGRGLDLRERQAAAAERQNELQNDIFRQAERREAAENVQRYREEGIITPDMPPEVQAQVAESRPALERVANQAQVPLPAEQAIRTMTPEEFTQFYLLLDSIAPEGDRANLAQELLRIRGENLPDASQIGGFQPHPLAGPPEPWKLGNFEIPEGEMAAKIREFNNRQLRDQNEQREFMRRAYERLLQHDPRFSGPIEPLYTDPQQRLESFEKYKTRFSPLLEALNKPPR